jgi:L-rhamnose isomerase
LGVDVHRALKILEKIPISLHCWQGDDVGGFENFGGTLGGGLVATGNYPGKARTPQELRADAEKALSLIPGKHRFNLHAFYGDFGGKKVDRNQIRPEHFQSWIDWARSIGIGLDFNPTCFSHPKAADGFTLSHADKNIRKFWIEHCIRCREIGAVMGRALGSPTVTNVWIPDGMKDTPADRRGPRERLATALDEVFKKPLDPKHNLDAIEGKLFGIGAESYTVGMHEFYLGYAVKHQKLVCLDAGHFHPTENMADKISSVLCFVPEILLHVSRGVRWDSDHVVILDASINRIAAWTIGARNMLRALCIAMLDPVDKLKQLELAGDYTSRLALMEEAKTMPFAAVWDYYCLKSGAPVGEDWLVEVKKYEKEVLSKRR